MLRTGLLKIFLATMLLMGVNLVNAAEPIKIGTFLTVTGPAAFLGDPELKTLQMVIEDLNVKGGLNGRKIVNAH